MSEQTIYISYAGAKTPVVARLEQAVIGAGHVLATNIHTVRAGVPQKRALQASMAGASRILLCFSSSHEATAAYEAVELSLAAERIAAHPRDAGWLIPVRLDRCEIPPVRVGDVALTELSAIDLGSDWDEGIARLVASLADAPEKPSQAAATTRGTSTYREEIQKLQAGEIEIINVRGPGNGDGDAVTDRKIESMTIDRKATFVNRNNLKD